MKYKYLISLSFLFFSIIYIRSQSAFNRTYPIPLGIGRYEMLHEAQDKYYAIGYADYGPEVGVQVVCHDKVTGDTCGTAYFEIPGWWLFTAGHTDLIDEGDRLLFGVCGNSSMIMLAYLKDHNRIVLQDSINNPIRGGAYLHDIKRLGDTTVYHGTVTQSKDNVSVVYIRYPDQSKKYVLIPNEPPLVYTGGKIHRDDSGNIYVIGVRNHEDAYNFNLSITTLNSRFELIDQWNASKLNNFMIINDVVQENDSTSLIICTQNAPDLIKNTYGFCTWVYKVNLRSKKIIWSKTYYTKASISFIPVGEIVKGHKEGEYIYTSMGYAKGSTIDSNYIAAQITKINTNGQKIYQKEYHYLAAKYIENVPYSLLKTSDGNYLLGGEIFGTGPTSAWLLKFDESGNIVPIDTLSTTIASPIPEISIYPNPAQNYIIINQGEIDEVYYKLYDLQGRLVKELFRSSSHVNTVWDISDLNTGSYILSIWKNENMMYSQKIIKQ
jgi:hypothetical protein